jgi:F0F1-type ATP synthase assembly protein I
LRGAASRLPPSTSPPPTPTALAAYNEAMDDFVPGVAAALGGLALIFWRRQFAASTVRQQNRFWRTKYGPAQVAFSEQAAILIGVFSLVMAVSFWLDLFWPPVIVLAGGVLGLNVLRLRRRRVSKRDLH